MDSDRFSEILSELSAALPFSCEVREPFEFEGFETFLEQGEEEDPALYLKMNFGSCTAGRTMAVLRLMLEANVIVYAWDQAQLGLDPDNSTIILIARLDDSVNGSALLESLEHYATHGNYWRQNIIDSQDEMFLAIAHGEHEWLKV